ncbi:MAG: hypothetical protein LUD83_09145 [Clostridiales bacterium]|nr:hypothetical protein [Clostridiales bacterium]
MKDFEEFAAKMNSSDWSAVVDSVMSKVSGKDRDAAIIQAALLLNLHVLREYHNWLNAD